MDVNLCICVCIASEIDLPQLPVFKGYSRQDIESWYFATYDGGCRPVPD
jgi:hypothetical protein